MLTNRSQNYLRSELEPEEAKPLTVKNPQLLTAIQLATKLSEAHLQAHEAQTQIALWHNRTNAHNKADNLKYWNAAYTQAVSTIVELHNTYINS